MREYNYKCLRADGKETDLSIVIKSWQEKDLLPQDKSRTEVKFTASIIASEGQLITPQNNPAHFYGLNEEEAKNNAEIYLKQIGYIEIKPT